MEGNPQRKLKKEIRVRNESKNPHDETDVISRLIGKERMREASRGMDFFRGLGEASEAPPHPHCLVTPLSMFTSHWVKWGKAIHTKLPPGVPWKNYIQDDQFLLGGEEKLKIKGTRGH